MTRTAFAPVSGIAQEALKMLFALEAGQKGNSFGVQHTFALEAQSSLEAERLDLLECVQQELIFTRQPTVGKPGFEVCADLLQHLAGCQVIERSARIQ